jgi:hypothetical protein
MARAKKADDSSSPKKSTSKAKSNGGAAAAPAEARIPSTMATVTRMTLSDEQVRVRAYELYLERRGNGGTAEEDWFRAEAELRGKSA